MADKKTHGAGPDGDLDSLFAAARRVKPADDLVTRVLADAQVAQVEMAAPPLRRKSGFVRPPAWITALGGWSGLGGVTAAGLVGLGLGYWSPDLVDVISGGQFGTLAGGGLSPDLVELALESGDV